MKNELLDKSIWITGASRGIGFELAKAFLESGAKVELFASSPNSFKRRDEIIDYKESYNLNYIDLANTDLLKSELNDLINKKGVPDIFINNAGIAVFKSLLDTSAEEFEKINAINYLAPFEIFKALLPGMIKQEKGMFINILSVAANTPFSNCSVYSASKAALMQMSNSLREEVRSLGIKIINIFPGATSTEIWDQESLEKFENRMIKPNNLAQSILNITKASYINGLTIEDVIVKPDQGNL